MRRISAFAEDDYHHFAISKSAYQIAQAGGIVDAGAHGQRQGLGFHWEIQMFGQGGMSAHQALYAGTMGTYLQNCALLRIGSHSSYFLLSWRQGIGVGRRFGLDRSWQAGGLGLL